MVTAVLFKRINNIYNASNYLFSTLCANPPYANHLKKPHTTNNLTSEFADVCVVKNLSVYLNCERLFRLRRDEKVKMPCRAQCRLQLSLVQYRCVLSWVVSTITLLENSARMFEFTRENPWPGFIPANTESLISYFNNLYTITENVIQGLIRITATGCHVCQKDNE